MAEAEPVVLAHELVHAYMHAASGKTTFLHANAVRFFNEGVATWMEEYLVGPPNKNDPFREWAGAIYQADQHRFEWLLNSSKRAQQYDVFQDYPLGLVFVEALVEQYGVEAPVCLLNAMAEAGTRPVHGVGLWYGMFDRCGLDLASVIERYEARLSGYAARFPMQDLDFSTKLIRTPQGLVLQISENAFNLRCRFRSEINAPPSEMNDQPVIGGQCRVPYLQQGELTVWYQVGMELPGGFVMFERWISTSSRTN